MKIAPSESRADRRPHRTEPVILFSISGQIFAINANAIHEIRSTDSISAAAFEIALAAVPKVRHILRRGRRLFPVVNGCIHFGLPTSRPAQVLILRDSRISLLVDSIERMETISLLMALPPGFCGVERSWYRGITIIDGNVVPVINPSGFLDEQELAQLDAAASDVSAAQPPAEAQQPAPMEHSQ